MTPLFATHISGFTMETSSFLELPISYGWHRRGVRVSMWLAENDPVDGFRRISLHLNAMSLVMQVPAFAPIQPRCLDPDTAACIDRRFTSTSHRRCFVAPARLLAWLFIFGEFELSAPPSLTFANLRQDRNTGICCSRQSAETYLLGNQCFPVEIGRFLWTLNWVTSNGGNVGLSD